MPMVEEEFEEDVGLGGADHDVPPPAYGEHHDQLQFSHAGFSADAAVTSEQAVYLSCHQHTLTRRALSRRPCQHPTEREEQSAI